MSGYVYLERGIFDHPLFVSNQPFSEREAFIWLFTHANYAESRFRHKLGVHTIPRGSYATSYRALASEWKWSHNRVIRVFKLWENEGMIDVETDHGFVQITLRNYESYQNRRTGDGPLPDRTRTTVGPPTDTNQRKGKEGKEGKGKTSPYPPEFEQFWLTYPKNNGSKKDAAAAYNRAIAKGIDHETVIRGAERYARYIASRADGARYTRHASRWLNGQCWEADYSVVRTASEPDRRDPAARAYDGAQEINRKRLERWAAEDARLARDTSAGESAWPDGADQPALADLRQPEDLWGQG